MLLQDGRFFTSRFFGSGFFISIEAGKRIFRVIVVAAEEAYLKRDEEEHQTTKRNHLKYVRNALTFFLENKITK